MNKIFFLTITILLGTVMCSCQQASFTDPGTSITVVSDLWYTTEPAGNFGGMIHLQDDHHGGYDLLPPNTTIIVAWEMPNDPTRSLYVYGQGTYSLSGKYNYSYTVHLKDTLPNFILKNKDTANVIAAGHIFLMNNATIKNGDTLRHNFNWDSLQVIGSFNNAAILFTKGNPSLAGRNFIGITPGFNAFFATRWDFKQSVIDFRPVYDPGNIDIQVDSGNDCQANTPLWLQ